MAIEFGVGLELTIYHHGESLPPEVVQFAQIAAMQADFAAGSIAAGLPAE